MTGKVGDRIVVESETVGQPTREGEILEVVEGEVGLRYRVRWADGHETVFTPSGGSAKIVPAKARAKAPAKTPAKARAKTPAKARAKTPAKAPAKAPAKTAKR